MARTQAEIPLAQSTVEWVDSLYELMDSAYDPDGIWACSSQRGHVPLIDSEPRRGGRKKAKLQREALAQRRGYVTGSVRWWSASTAVSGTSSEGDTCACVGIPRCAAI